MIAGMMIIAGVNMLKLAKDERAEDFFSVQAPILGFLLLNIGMGALFLDLDPQAVRLPPVHDVPALVADVLGLVDPAPGVPRSWSSRR